MVSLTGLIRSDIEVTTEEARMDAELKQTGNALLSRTERESVYTFYIRRTQ